MSEKSIYNSYVSRNLFIQSSYDNIIYTMIYFIRSTQSVRQLALDLMTNDKVYNIILLVFLLVCFSCHFM